jgi:hypothetical protein
MHTRLIYDHITHQIHPRSPRCKLVRSDSVTNHAGTRLRSTPFSFARWFTSDTDAVVHQEVTQQLRSGINTPLEASFDLLEKLKRGIHVAIEISDH